MLAFLSSLLLTLPLIAFANSANSTNAIHVDKVLVVKSERALHLMHQGKVVKSYRVSLGKKTGPKEYEGDQRTPEGLYWINWRKHSNNFNLSMHISYPNTTDLKRSEESGLPPGGMIMLHGTPNDDEYPEWFFNTLDWTEGCIALNNSDMKEVWDKVQDGTLIEIRP